MSGISFDRKIAPSRSRKASAVRKPLNILIMAACTSHKGGLEVMSLQVAEEMKRRGHNIVLAYREEGDDFNAFRNVTAAYYKVALGPLGLQNPFAAIRLLTELVRITKQHKIDVCFSSNVGLARTTGMIRALTGVGCVYHLGLFCGPLDVWTRWGLRRGSVAVAPFINVAESWRAVGLPKEQIEVCPNWTDIEKFRRRALHERTALKTRLGISPDRPVISYVGRLSADKGLPTLLEALSILNRQRLEPQVVLVGHLDPSYRQTYEAMVDGKLSRRPHLVGLVNNPEDYLAVADIAVVPSVAPETFGLTLIEAMSSELVTIASRASNFAEILGEENKDLLFARGSAEECAQRLRTWLLANATERAERGQSLRQRVIREYSSKNAAIYQSAFYRVAAARQPRSTT